MFRQMLKSKIQNAVITKKDLYYSGSIGIDGAILSRADIIPGEKVQVLNFNNGQRFETYIIEEMGNSGSIVLYGPAARLGEIGDNLFILSYAMMDDEEIEQHRPVIVLVDENNQLK